MKHLVCSFVEKDYPIMGRIYKSVKVRFIKDELIALANSVCPTREYPRIMVHSYPVTRNDKLSNKKTARTNLIISH